MSEKMVGSAFKSPGFTSPSEIFLLSFLCSLLYMGGKERENGGGGGGELHK